MYFTNQSFQKNSLISVGFANQIFFTEIFLGKIQPILDTENDFETQNFEIFDQVVHTFG